MYLLFINCKFHEVKDYFVNYFTPSTQNTSWYVVVGVSVFIGWWKQKALWTIADKLVKWG